MKNKMWIIMCFLCVSCSSGSKPLSPDDFAEQKETRLGPGMKELEKGDFQAAHKFFDKFLARYPVSQFTTSALFYDGIALNELGQFSEAINRLQTVGQLTEGKDPYLEAESLYHLGKSFEGLGEDPRALATLIDAEKRARYLPKQLADVEVPARIAGVYARQGQMASADKYYNKAEEGLAKLKGKAALEKQEWIPKALYGMGKISPRNISESDFEGGLKSLRRSQSYLLRATEFNHPSWSGKAEQEIENIYESAWSVIANYPLEESEDKLASLKRQQDRMIELGLILNSVLSQLNQEFIVGQEIANPHIAKLKMFLDTFDKKIDALVGSRPVSEGLTPEAERLEGIKREGKVVDPTGVLEKGQKRLNEKLPIKKEKK